MEAKVKIAQIEKITGNGVHTSTKFLYQMEGVFLDKEAFNRCDKEQRVYEVQAYMPVDEGKVGGLFF